MVSPRFRGAPVMAVSSFFFASMAVLARFSATRLHASQLVLARFVVGLVVVAALFRVARGGLSVKRPLLWVVRGICGGGSAYFYFQSIEHLGAGPATLLNYLGPIFGAIFGIVFLRETLRARLVFGLLAALAGSALVVASATGVQGLSGRGVGEGLLAAVFTGAALTMVRSLRADTGALAIFFSFCLFGLLWAVPFALSDWKPLAPTDLWLALGVGVFSAVAQLLMTYAFKYLSAGSGGAWTQLTPAFAWILGVLVLGEGWSPTGLVGVGLCIGGVLWGTGVVDLSLQKYFPSLASSKATGP